LWQRRRGRNNRLQAQKLGNSQVALTRCFKKKSSNLKEHFWVYFLLQSNGKGGLDNPVNSDWAGNFDLGIKGIKKSQQLLD